MTRIPSYHVILSKKSMSKCTGSYEEPVFSTSFLSGLRTQEFEVGADLAIVVSA